jgi:hypothetical protein
MTDFNHLPAGRELDKLIAQKIFGQTLEQQCSSFQSGRCDGTRRVRCGSCGGTGHGNCYGRSGGFRLGGEVDVPCERACDGTPSYSERLEDAWEVVEKLAQPRPDGFALYRRGFDTWQAKFFCEVSAVGPTPALAICRSALLAVEDGTRA